MREPPRKGETWIARTSRYGAVKDGQTTERQVRVESAAFDPLANCITAVCIDVMGNKWHVLDAQLLLRVSLAP